VVTKNTKSKKGETKNPKSKKVNQDVIDWERRRKGARPGSLWRREQESGGTRPGPFWRNRHGSG
jgi:hypothetical protein